MLNLHETRNWPVECEVPPEEVEPSELVWRKLCE